jgi:hypothetical protein
MRVQKALAGYFLPWADRHRVGSHATEGVHEMTNQEV